MSSIPFIPVRTEMNSFPLIRAKWSNERLMTALLLVLAIYGLPRFFADRGDIGKVLILLAFALVLDTVVNFIRFRRPVCAVSAAVTTLILYTLTPRAPLWIGLVALLTALLAGKHVWGGTGKNPINPAMVGVLVSGFLFPLHFPVFESSLLLLPAVLLSLPFLYFRPYAGIGMGLGISMALILQNSLTPASLLGFGVVFWAAVVMTDPTTITAKPLPGAIAGLLAGFVPLVISRSVFAIALGVLAANVLSYFVDRYSLGANRRIRLSLKQERILFLPGNTVFHDFTDDNGTDQVKDPFIIERTSNEDPDIGNTVDDTLDTVNSVSGTSNISIFENMSCEEILERIENGKVFGFGGAAFPAAKKIRTSMNSKAVRKHLIINGVECDPGLIHDKWLLQNKTAEIRKGIELLCRCIPFSTVTIAVKESTGIDIDTITDTKPGGCVGVDRTAGNADDGGFPLIRIQKIADHYPAGAEKSLINEVLGIELKNDEIPAAAGILVLNTQTVFSIYEAACLNRKADTRFITFAELDRKSGSVLRVRLGADVHGTVDKVRTGFIGVYTGGGMMNAHLSSNDSIIDKKVNFLAVGRVQRERDALCSQCGFCSAVCPARLEVNQITSLVDAGKLEETARFHPEMCLNCGSCSYVCLAGRNLAIRMNKAKNH